MSHFALLCTAASAATLLASAADAQSRDERSRLLQAAPALSPKLAVVVPRQAADVARIVPAAAAPALPDTILLRSADPSASIQQLSVQRELSQQEIRSTRALQLGSATVDLSSMLDNRDALPNVASRLRASPNSVSVKASDLTAYVVPQGLIVRSFLNYQIKPGACTDAARRGQIESAGVSCARRMSESERVAEYSNPNSPRFVADSARRSEAVAKARQDWAEQDAATTAHVANFRAILSNPTERAKVEAEIGAAETARIANLGDEDLTRELINSAETKIEDVMFIPKDDVLDRSVRDLAATGRLEALESGGGTVTAGGRARDLAGRLGDRVNVLEGTSPALNQPIKQVFLTGFTLGRQYEWSKRIEKTINWCWVGCSETYYAGARAGFSYGFGLRFPIVVDGKYNYANDGSGEHAFLTATMTPVDGTPQQYAAAGLASSQIFNGQELVAELQAGAGYEYKLPLMGESHHSLTVGFNLADKLPAPYAHGQFRPPAPGTNAGEIPFVFTSLDLLMGYGNWGAAGILVHPAVKVGLHSDALKFTVHDNFANTDQTLVNAAQLPLAIDQAQHQSSFSIGSPVYNLSFIVTPGVDAHAFIDITVWSDEWHFPVWFPAVAITLPPGGVNFSCHAGTTCRRNYVYAAAAAPTNPVLDSAAAVGDLSVKADDNAGPTVGVNPGIRDAIRNRRPKAVMTPTVQDPPPQVEVQPPTPQ
jgi:hypothetical protein